MSDEHRFTADKIAEALTASFEGTLRLNHTWIDSCERVRPLTDAQSQLQISGRD